MKTKLILSLILLLSFSTFAQQSHEKFDQYLNQAVKDFELAGMTIAIVKDGETIFENAYGFANEDTKKKMELTSTFAIASLSKAFTATAIGMLVDDGKLKWNDRVKGYLPYFTLSDEDVAAQMTMEDLLCHRSGFKTFDGDLLWYGTNYTPKEIIEHFSHYKMAYDFRTTYGYQNIMFIIAGQVVEQVSGMSLEAFLKQRIFTPLGMDHTYSSISEYQENTKIAMPHVKGKVDELRNYDNSSGAAQLSSNVIDLSKWINFWLKKGIVNGDTLLTKATYETILNVHTPIPPSSFDRSNGIEFKGYGLGWFLQGYDGAKIAHHGGGLPGYISKIFLVPSKNLGGIILTNGGSYLPSALMNSCIDEFGGIENNKDWAATYLKFAQYSEERTKKKKEERYAERNERLKSNIPQERLLGSYNDDNYGQATIKKEGNKLWLTLVPSQGIFSSELTHWQQNTFRIKFKDKYLPEGFVTFCNDANGNVKSFTIDLPNPDFHFYNLNFKKQ